MPGSGVRSVSARAPVRLAVGVAVAAAMVGATAPAARASLPPGTVCSLPATGTAAGRPWAQQRLDPERVWPLTTGAGVTVAVVDTGVDAGQPFLRGHVLPGSDVVNGGPADDDCDGHGTLVAGLVAGQQLPGSGFAGVAPGAMILPVRQADNSTPGSSDTLARAITAAVAGGASVINVSITTTAPTPALTAAVQDAVSHNVVVVAAAGNDQQTGNAPLYPAALPGVLSVGAIDQNGQPADFSASGPTVGVAAPGQNIVGPGAGGSGLVAGAQGTSYAAPFVSGVAALVRAYHPGLTAAQVIHRIEATADHPPGVLPNSQTGWGVVDPYQAVTAILPEEDGLTARPPSRQPVSRMVLPPTDHTLTLAAVGITAACAALAAAIAAAALTVRRIRRGERPEQAGKPASGRRSGNPGGPAAPERGKPREPCGPRRA